MGAVFNDHAQVTDSISATIETEVVPAKVPCPECGKETTYSGHPQRTGIGIRICSRKTCRAVTEGIEEVTSKKLLAGGSPAFPCPATIELYDVGTGKTREQKCGKATTVKASDPLPSLGRICLDRTCRHEFELS